MRLVVGRGPDRTPAPGSGPTAYSCKKGDGPLSCIYVLGGTAEADARPARGLADVDDLVELQVDSAVGGLELVPAVALQGRAQALQRVAVEPHGQRRTALESDVHPLHRRLLSACR